MKIRKITIRRSANTRKVCCERELLKNNLRTISFILCSFTKEKENLKNIRK
jgi:hypothetical protein